MDRLYVKNIVLLEQSLIGTVVTCILRGGRWISNGPTITMCLVWSQDFGAITYDNRKSEFTLLLILAISCSSSVVSLSSLSVLLESVSDPDAS
jgi:hypothetical protein